MNSCIKWEKLSSGCCDTVPKIINSEDINELNAFKHELYVMNQIVDGYTDQINNLLAELRIEDTQRKNNMDGFTEDEVKDAQEFSDFYFDLIENQKDTFVYYLSETATLDWFGQTVKGIKNIEIFLKTKVPNVSHNFPTVEPCNKIGYRDSHFLKISSRETRKRPLLKIRTDEEKTPPNQITRPSGSKIQEKGQGDGVHNCASDSPAKRSRLAGDVIESENITPATILYISSEGHVEFHKRSMKKFQRETKWSRPCKFEVAYSKSPSGYVIHLIIYEGNMKCRRNLLKEFDAEDGTE